MVQYRANDQFGTREICIDEDSPLTLEEQTGLEGKVYMPCIPKPE